MLILIHIVREQEDRNKEINDRIIRLEVDSATIVKEDPEPIIVFIQPVVCQISEPPVEIVSDELDGREYLEQCIEAEAGNQGVIGKAYVCDVILNRLEWKEYSSVYDVINDRGQFQCVSNGTINKVSVSEETKYVVSSELNKKLDEDITFFRTNRYHSGTIPCFKYGAHYFSKRK